MGRERAESRGSRTQRKRGGETLLTTNKTKKPVALDSVIVINSLHVCFRGWHS